MTFASGRFRRDWGQGGFAVTGDRFAVTGDRFAVTGDRFAVTGDRFAVSQMH